MFYSKVLSKSTVNTVHEAMVLLEEYPWQTLNSLNSSSLLLLVFDYKIKPAFYSVRLSVRTVGFQSTKRGSIPLPSTRFNYIGYQHQ